LEEEQQEPPPDFDDQIKELLDSRVARFGPVKNGDLGEANQGDSKDDPDTATDEKTQSNNDSPSPSPFLEITYPSRIMPPNSSKDHALDDTARLWTDIRSLSYALDDDNYEYQYQSETNGKDATEHDKTNEHDSSFLYRLADHLEHTGRLLSWKHAMNLERKDILFRETLHKKHEIWVKEQRTAKLEQLYQVRETLVHRKDVAKEDFDKLVAVKENAIRRDMLLYDHNMKRTKRSGNGSLLGGGELSFPEEFEMMGLLPKDSQLYEEEDWGGTLDDEDDFHYYNSDYSEDDYSDLSGFSGDEEGDDHKHEDSMPHIAPIGEKSINNNSPTNLVTATEIPDNGNTAVDVIGIAAPTTTGTTSKPKPFLRRNRERRQKKARALKKRELAEAQRKEEREKRKEHGVFLEAKHTTNELILAQTLLEALERKVIDVEELLENLQDEEWAAVEEAETEKSEPQTNTAKDKKDGMSLLDQILAMILGALPMEPGSKDRERHFLYIKEEHEFIVNGWKDYFGRLPPTFVSGASKDDPSTSIPPVDTNEEQDSVLARPTALERNDHKSNPTRGFAAPPSAAAVKLSKITSRKSSSNTVTAATAATPQEQRIALGIVDNEDGDWDTVADDE